jgi:hypothetical protein
VLCPRLADKGAQIDKAWCQSAPAPINHQCSFWRSGGVNRTTPRMDDAIFNRK